MTDILFTTKSGNVCIRDKEGRFRSVKSPAFKHRQIVTTSAKHYSKEAFTMVLEPTWSEVRGWIYGQSFIRRDNISGGGQSWWNEEDRFEPLSDPNDILLAEKLQLEKRKQEAVDEIKYIDKKLTHLKYALSLLEKE